MATNIQPRKNVGGPSASAIPRISFSRAGAAAQPPTLVVNHGIPKAVRSGAFRAPVYGALGENGAVVSTAAQPRTSVVNHGIPKPVASRRLRTSSVSGALDASGAIVFHANLGVPQVIWSSILALPRMRTAPKSGGTDLRDLVRALAQVAAARKEATRSLKPIWDIITSGILGQIIGIRSTNPVLASIFNGIIGQIAAADGSSWDWIKQHLRGTPQANPLADVPGGPPPPTGQDPGVPSGVGGMAEGALSTFETKVLEQVAHDWGLDVTDQSFQIDVSGEQSPEKTSGVAAPPNDDLPSGTLGGGADFNLYDVDTAGLDRQLDNVLANTGPSVPGEGPVPQEALDEIEGDGSSSEDQSGGAGGDGSGTSGGSSGDNSGSVDDIFGGSDDQDGSSDEDQSDPTAGIDPMLPDVDEGADPEIEDPNPDWTVGTSAGKRIPAAVQGALRIPGSGAASDDPFGDYSGSGPALPGVHDPRAPVSYDPEGNRGGDSGKKRPPGLKGPFGPAGMPNPLGGGPMGPAARNAQLASVLAYILSELRTLGQK